jgi:hypothetical protein
MSVEWARNSAWKEVPTMKSTFMHVPSAASARGGAVACIPGTCRPGGVTTLLVRNTDVIVAKPPSTGKAAMAATQPTTFENYQHKTRISAASGGVSGSPPAWDPV